MKVTVLKLLKKKRVKLDGILKYIDAEFNKGGKEGYIRELKLSYTAVQKGRMYLGEVMHDLGAKYPYKSTNKAKNASGIKIATDMIDSVSPLQGNNIEKLVKLRYVLNEDVKEIVNAVTKARQNYIFVEDSKYNAAEKRFIADCNMSEVYRSLKEGRMWLGCAMGVIKVNSLKK